MECLSFPNFSESQQMKSSATIFLFISGLLVSCGRNEPQGDWIRGNASEKLKTIEKHFRGLDNAMVETGYRYQELYWGGLEGNWPYAKYQADKIKLAIEYSLERRPKRIPSAEPFLQYSLPQIQKSIDSKDTSDFRKSFQLLTTACNNCHQAENVSHFNVKEPELRLSIIRK
jgi:hypothetical protein